MGTSKRNICSYFTHNEASFYIKRAGFTSREESLFRLRCDEVSLEESAEELNCSLSTINRIHKRMMIKICKIAEYYYYDTKEEWK